MKTKTEESLFDDLGQYTKRGKRLAKELDEFFKDFVARQEKRLSPRELRELGYIIQMAPGVHIAMAVMRKWCKEQERKPQ